jgi:hypothetical protein
MAHDGLDHRMSEAAIIRTFLVFFGGGLLMTAAVIGVFSLVEDVRLLCFEGNAGYSCGNVIWIALATPFAAIMVAMTANLLPLIAGPLLAALGRGIFHRVPVWYLPVILAVCVLVRLAQTPHEFYFYGRPVALAEHVVGYSIFQFPILLICWWWDRAMLRQVHSSDVFRLPSEK